MRIGGAFVVLCVLGSVASADVALPARSADGTRLALPARSVDDGAYRCIYESVDFVEVGEAAGTSFSTTVDEDPCERGPDPTTEQLAAVWAPIEAALADGGFTTLATVTDAAQVDSK